jgi:hypothetical protein
VITYFCTETSCSSRPSNPSTPTPDHEEVVRTLFRPWSIVTVRFLLLRLRKSPRHFGLASSCNVTAPCPRSNYKNPLPLPKFSRNFLRFPKIIFKWFPIQQHFPVRDAESLNYEIQELTKTNPKIPTRKSSTQYQYVVKIQIKRIKQSTRQAILREHQTRIPSPIYTTGKALLMRRESTFALLLRLETQPRTWCSLLDRLKISSRSRASVGRKARERGLVRRPPQQPL